ncbi:uncharacterized protein LOC112183998 [Rosa chinensis]|uniref:uncharacterized protein LOC112183998 n=1 Tax=Rosa chinensis TaxID=74649 RepID=UPI000D089189|nr:uncharacterized protein LOC112183998 [Rosa chinensis]
MLVEGRGKLNEYRDPKHEEIIPHVDFIPEIVLKPIKAYARSGCSIEENAMGKRKAGDIDEGEGYNEDDDDNVHDRVNIDEDGSFDEDYVDSDYKILPGDEGYSEDGQDDLEYKENVDNRDVYDEYADMGFNGEISDHSHDSKELRDLVEETKSNDEAGVKVEVACGKKHKGKRETWPCQFWISASVIKGKEPELIIKSINLNHKNCETVSRMKFCTSTFLAEEYVQVWKADPYISRKLFQEIVSRDFGQTISHKQVVRARILAALMNSGNEADQYNLLETSVEVLRQSNPGSTIELVTDMDGGVRKFKRFYVCFDACKRGWMAGCRPIVGLDGCHIKIKYPGLLLLAVGIDANNGMFPIAYAVVEMENYETWSWFLAYLIGDLDMQNDFSYVFMSDKQKGLLDVVKDLMPNSEHRHCVRHLHNNFKVKNPGIVLKNLLWSAARDTTKIWFNKHWEDIRAVSADAIDWLNKHENSKHWSRSHFREESKSDMLLNNLCEAFNAEILDCRDKPMLVMLEMLRQNLMVRMNNRRVAGMKWKSEIGPRIQKIIEKNINRSREYNSFRSSDYVFEVQGKKGSVLQSQRTVDLANGACTCRRWTLSSLPCPHAIHCIFIRGEDPKQYVHMYYKKQAYLDAYAHLINPVPGIEYWTIRVVKIHPPQYKRQPGKPKKARTKEEAKPPAPEPTKVCGNTTRMSRSCQNSTKEGSDLQGT